MVLCLNIAFVAYKDLNIFYQYIVMASYGFKCKDIGMDCGFTASAKTKEELMPKIAEHAKHDHHIETIDEALQAKVNGAIRKKMFF